MLGLGVLVLKLIALGSGIHFEMLEKDIEIAILIIGGSLILPQLTGNDFIRSMYSLEYMLPIVLGSMILIW